MSVFRGYGETPQTVEVTGLDPLASASKQGGNAGIVMAAAIGFLLRGWFGAAVGAGLVWFKNRGK